MQPDDPSEATPTPDGKTPPKIRALLAERELLLALKENVRRTKESYQQLASFYRKEGDFDASIVCCHRLAALENDLELKARSLITAGCVAEQKGDFEAAAGYYREALALEPMQQDAWYFIHNNLGFSFNQMGRFAEGEKCCRAAIEICFARPNGHKNLGMALSGQGRFREAAQSYHTAMKVAPDDPRSFDLLRNLLREHPELRNDFGHGLR